MKSICFSFLFSISISLFAQKPNKLSYWQGYLHRTDGINIPINFTLDKQRKKPVIYIINASEKIKIDNIVFTKDSVFIKMPVFESSFKAALKNDHWDGVWIKGTSANDQVLPFSAYRRIDSVVQRAENNVTGKWAVTFASDKSKADASIAEFKQTGNKLAGTFLTPTGDYRFLEGNVDGSKLRLSTFDGSHAFLFTAEIKNKNEIINGMFYSGARGKDAWTAVKDANAKVSTNSVAMYLKPGEEKLNFSFPDFNGKKISINDNRFKNKVVIVQILGSWCPNCMDETAFLSDYYNKNKSKGVEVIGLAYEYSTDFNRSVKSLRKFQQRYNVTYPILITGVKVTDTLRTEKTLPQVTPIRVFPSSIIIDKRGKVRKFDTSFFGPGTGEHYEEYKREFYATIDALLKEK